MSTQTIERIETMDDAIKLANEINRMDAALKQKKELLKSFVQANGKVVETDKEIWGFNPTVSWSFNAESLKRFCEGLVVDGINPWNHLSISAAELKKLGYGEQALKRYATRKDSRKFGSKVKK